MATRHIPTDEFHVQLYRQFIQERIWRLWPQERLSVLISADMNADGSWTLTIGPRDIRPGALFDADVQGTIWIDEDANGRPEVVWRVGDESNHDGMLPTLPY